MRHWAIFTDNTTPVRELVSLLLEGPVPIGFEALEEKKGALFSTMEIARFMEEEIRHDRKILTEATSQSLQSMSSGERKKALLKYVLSLQPDYLILDHPFDNLDHTSRKTFISEFDTIKDRVHIIQMISRKADLLPFITQVCRWQEGRLRWKEGEDTFGGTQNEKLPDFDRQLPPPPEPIPYPHQYLMEMDKVSVAYGEKAILHEINWQIKPGEFWELKGANGSGKTTLLSLITGDNPKAYGQNLSLFNRKKGSGESVWEIKRQIGYVTPALTDRFRGYHTVEHMLISGLTDSIGLYIIPSESQKKLARLWLDLLGMTEKIHSYFHDLTKGEQRLLMCARAMVKHPLLLILDEPTADLDDEAAALVVALVNKMAHNSQTAIIFVSHREEPKLTPQKIFELKPTINGSIGNILNYR